MPPKTKKDKPPALVTRFAYHGVFPVDKGYRLDFSGHRSDFPTSEDAGLFMEVQTDRPPTEWNMDWWPMAIVQAYSYFRQVAVKDIKGTPLVGLPGGEKL